MIYINQEGYIPQAEKVFYYQGSGQSFQILESSSKSQVYQGALTQRSLKDLHTGLNLKKGDFSDFAQEGEFLIKIGESFSDTFTLSDGVYKDVYLKGLHSFYYQRCGVELPEDLAGIHSHGECHSGQVPFHYSAELSGFKEVSGGWHDAGDYGRYIIPGALSCALMLLGYQQYPERFNAEELRIPERGNGTPEFLSEIAFELRWMLKMQNLQSGPYFGGVHYMVNTKDYTWDRPDNDPDQLYIYGLSSRATACFAAICAMACRIFNSLDGDFAKELLVAARRAWSFLMHYSPYPTGGFQRPSDTETGGYATSAKDNKKDEKDILWAAVELWLSTKEVHFKDYIEEQYSRIPKRPGGLNWMDTGGFWQLQLLLNSHDIPFPLEKLEKKWIKKAEQWVRITGKNGFSVALGPKDYQWGSNGDLMTRALVLILLGEKYQRSSYKQAALEQLHYLLGRNYHSMSFVTRTGKRWPENIHHAHLGSQALEPFPGLVAGGPNYKLSDPLMQGRFNWRSPPATCYLDELLSCASNENCILYNAPLIPVAAYFSAGL